MKLILSVLIFIFAVQAQAQSPKEEVVLGYTQDVEINGKVFERYQTPKGDNVLIGKEAAKKRGVFLFGKARDLLANDGTWGFGFISVTGFMAWNNKKHEVRHAELAATQPFGESFKPYAEKDDRPSSPVFQPYLHYRPKAYRHVSIKGGIELPLSEKLYGLGYVFAANHDVIVIPGKDNYFALAAGYQFSRHAFVYDFSDGNNHQNIREWFNENSLVVSGRYVMEVSSGGLAIDVSGAKGDKGGKRLGVAIVWGFN